MIVYMKKFTIALLGAIFVALIACSIQSVSADHLEPGTGLFITESETSLVTSNNTNYQIHLQLVIRNGDEQLISVLENNIGGYIPHKITDDIFDTAMGEKEIITIDNIMYEKVQWTNSGGYTPDERNKKTKDYSIWKIGTCADFSDIGHSKHQCISIFQVLLPTITLELGDVSTENWTILRELGV
jgi:hypothetical protein